MQNAPKVGSIYEHYKKKSHYKVIALAKHSETLEDLVVYEDVSDHQKVWVRPLAMFIEQVECEGRKVQRFKPVD